MKRISVILILLLFLISCTKQLLIKNYPNGQPAYAMFGQIPERSFYYPMTLPDSLELIWEATVTGSFNFNSVVVEGNHVFTSDLAGNIFCIDTETGKVLGADKSKGEIAVAPILNNGIMYYIITQSGEDYSLLVSYDIRKGERLKEIEIPGRVGNEMIKIGNNFVFVSDDGVIYRYDTFLNRQWRTELNQKVYSSPAAHKNKLYVAAFNGELFCIDLNDGEIKYSKKILDNNEAAISIKDNIGLIGTNNGELVSFDLSDFSENWRFDTNAKIKSPAVMNDQNIYIGNLAGSYYCLNINNGEQIWKFESEGMFNATGALFENILLQPDVNGKLLFIDTDNGNIVKTIEYESRVKLHPAYFDDKLYIGIDRGELLVYQLVRN
ncbi:MAG: hypothetical protein C4543_06445 [Ignavibacteriales bacterium]|nr:MAG: hypothetical protein C4543_06445 [Ignavibacteriales bacterium]